MSAMFEGAYRVYRIFGGGAFLVFTERSLHQMWLASCRESDSGDCLVDPANEKWFFVEPKGGRL